MCVPHIYIYILSHFGRHPMASSPHNSACPSAARRCFQLQFRYLLSSKWTNPARDSGFDWNTNKNYISKIIRRILFNQHCFFCGFVKWLVFMQTWACTYLYIQGYHSWIEHNNFKTARWSKAIWANVQGAVANGQICTRMETHKEGVWKLMFIFIKKVS